MNILNNKAKMTAKELYALTHSPVTEKVFDIKGSVVSVDKWVLVEDYDLETGEVKQVLFMQIDGESTVYGTISKTFIEQFMDIVTFFGDVDSINVISAESKSGREYITCSIA